MRRTGWTPSIVPNGHDQTFYLVINNYGKSGAAFAETGVVAADLETTINDLMSGQYSVSALNSSSSFIEIVRHSVSDGLHREAGGFRRRWRIPKSRAQRDSNSCPPSATMSDGPMSDSIDLSEKLATFSEHFSPRAIARFNNCDVMVVKLKGEFVWHKHDDTDDFFLVLQGVLDIQLRDRTVTLGPGQIYIVQGRRASSRREGRGAFAVD
jgi:mannose-6-phosphate isomerase-like protein (cupin superfamily)